MGKRIDRIEALLQSGLPPFLLLYSLSHFFFVSENCLCILFCRFQFLPLPLSLFRFLALSLWSSLTLSLFQKHALTHSLYCSLPHLIFLFSPNCSLFMHSPHYFPLPLFSMYCQAPSFFLSLAFSLSIHISLSLTLIRTHANTHTHTHTWCVRCLLITERPKTPCHYRYQI